MTRRNWGLFFLSGLLWGIPYLFIKVAVDPTDGFSPATVVFGRVVIGAFILIPIAIKDRTIFDAIRGIKYVGIYALFEMIGPWILIGTAEQSISSGMAGLLIATVPIWSTLLTAFHGDRSVWQKKRIIGILVGFIGVFLVVGIESITGSSDPLAIGMVLLASMGYSYAVISVTRALPNVSGIAINGLAMVITAIACLPLTLTQLPDHPVSLEAVGSVVALGIFSTGLAFAVFFAMLKEVGPVRASLVTYLNTSFAVVLGVIILSEPLTAGIIFGLPLVLLGSYLASRKDASI